jgi:hypothetical protein
LAVGSYAITATYGGNDTHAASTSAPLTQTVNNKTNTTTALVSSLNPSVFGQPVTFTATITGGAPTGSVTFKDGAVTLGTGIVNPTNRQAALATSALAVGTHAITAVYSGSDTHAASTSAPLTQTVRNKTNTTTALVSSLNPSKWGQSVTFTATVTGGTPTGSVTFWVGPVALGTVQLNPTRQAALVTSTLAVRSHAIIAVYAGDATHNTSTSSTLTQTVNP